MTKSAWFLIFWFFIWAMTLAILNVPFVHLTDPQVDRLVGYTWSVSLLLLDLVLVVVLYGALRRQLWLFWPLSVLLIFLPEFLSPNSTFSEGAYLFRTVLYVANRYVVTRWRWRGAGFMAALYLPCELVVTIYVVFGPVPPH